MKNGFFTALLHRSVSALLCLVLCTACLCSAGAAEAEGAVFRIATAQAAQQAGEIEVLVKAEGLTTPVGGIGFCVLYDADVFELSQQPTFAAALESLDFKTHNGKNPGKIVVNIAGFENADLKDGTVLSFGLKVKENAPTGKTELALEELVMGYYDENALTVAVPCTPAGAAVEILEGIRETAAPGEETVPQDGSQEPTATQASTATEPTFTQEQASEETQPAVSGTDGSRKMPWLTVGIIATVAVAAVAATFLLLRKRKK